MQELCSKSPGNSGLKFGTEKKKKNIYQTVSSRQAVGSGHHSKMMSDTKHPDVGITVYKQMGLETGKMAK